MVGASGAIAGVMGAYLVKFPHSRIYSLVTMIFFFTTVEVPAWLMLIYWFVIQFFNGVGTIGYSHVSEGGGVAFFAHVGGFLAGIGSDQPDGAAPALFAASGPVLVDETAGDTLHARRLLPLRRSQAGDRATPAPTPISTTQELDIDSDPELRAPVQRRSACDRDQRSKAFKYRVNMNEFLKKLAARA